VTQAWINRIGTAVPPHDMHAAFVAGGIELMPDERSRALFARMAALSGIEHRYAIFKPRVGNGDALDADGFYRLGAFPSTGRRMERYQDAALDLAERAVAGLGDAAWGITHLVLASCTGFAAPGLEFRLMRRLGLPGSTERTLIGFMGCAAAATALRTARHIVRAEPSARVLVVCVELCSLHLQETRDLAGILSLLLFGDGAAAALVSAETEGIALGVFRTEVLPATDGLITWTIGDSGFVMELSGRVPGEIRRYLVRHGAGLLDRLGVAGADFWAVHAGGRTILDAVQDGLRLPSAALLASRGVLRDVGNVSSATLLFVLQRLMDVGGGPGVAMAFGLDRGELRIPGRPMSAPLRARSLVPERMESACADFSEYRRCLVDLAQVNRVTFTHGPTLAWLKRQTAELPAFSLVDVACGHGDFLLKVRRWVRKTGKTARLTGIDRHPWSVRAAREATPAADWITFVEADVFAWRPDEPPDFIVSSQFLHHLTDAQAIAFLRWQDRTARRGWLVADLIRNRFAYYGFPLLAHAARWHWLVRSDGQISIGRSWRPAELAALAASAGVAATVRTHGPFRMTLSAPAIAPRAPAGPSRPPEP